MRIIGYVYGWVLVVMTLVSFDTARAQPAASALPPPVQMSREDDLKRLAALVNVEPILKRPPYNYDESKANPYPNLPDPLVLKDGERVADAKMWWEMRRPEILEAFESEIYGRTPRVTPKVNWEVTSTSRSTNGDVPIITKQLVGHVDNSSYPGVTVDIQVVLTTPANAGGPVPVILQFSGAGFGFPGGGRGPARAGPATLPGIARRGGPTSLPGARAGGPNLPAGPTWQQQLLAKGWGYALLNTGSVQQDSGNGLNQGIIGLVNKGQPRKVDDWGVLSAWAWGASRALDYFESDPTVNAKQVGLEGHSRWGKATILAMALDQRFAIAYVSSSGEGGTKLHRRNFGQPVDGIIQPEEYHWFDGNFLKYAHHWDNLPVDSHELIALCAPRPVFVSGGLQNAGDRGADTKGSFLAAVGAGPVYRLLGKKDLGITEMPDVGVAVIDGDIAFREHEGGHTDQPNWPTFITFASRYFK